MATKEYIKFKTPTGEVLATKSGGTYQMATGDDLTNMALGKVKMTELVSESARPLDEYNKTQGSDKSLPPLGESNQMTQAFSLPQKGQKRSSLVEFSAALHQAVSLAKQKRLQASSEFLDKKIPLGATSASTFTSILSTMNQGGQSYTEDLTESALDAYKMEIDSMKESQRRRSELALIAADAQLGATVVSKMYEGTEEEAVQLMAGALAEKGGDKQLIKGADDNWYLADNKTGDTQKVDTGEAPAPGGGKAETNTVVTTTDGEAIDYSSVSGIKLLKDKGYTRGEIYAFLDENTKLTATAINGLLEDAGMPKEEEETEEEFLSKEYFEGLFTEDQLKDAAKDAGFTEGGFLGIGVGDEGVQNYLEYLVNLVEQYRKAGYTDQEILKMMQ